MKQYDHKLRNKSFLLGICWASEIFTLLLKWKLEIRDYFEKQMNNQTLRRYNCCISSGTAQNVFFFLTRYD